jgi:hypothetical protein
MLQKSTYSGVEVSQEDDIPHGILGNVRVKVQEGDLVKLEVKFKAQGSWREVTNCN